jgi:alpha-mannosidase
VAAGRWFPAGSSVEESDVNVISAESLIRQILYGSTFFRREFGKTSAEFMLPDCFGFPASLPSILAHAGIKGFSTQKLTWGSAAPVGGPSSPQNTPVGIRFNVGLWQGPDGRSVIAALNAGRYTGPVAHDLSKSPGPDLVAENAQLPVKDLVVDWPARVEGNGQASGLFTDYHYYGIGDRGGAPAEVSVKLMEAIVTRGRSALPSLQIVARRREAGEVIPLPTGPAVQMGDGPLKVVAATAEQMFLDITPEQTTRLPRYQGDLQLTEHSAGTLSSQAAMKRWNRQNEVLADDAERASVAAEWLGARAYPRERLTDAWTLVMAGQFHDILPGTSIPKAYEYSWNDQVLAANQFVGVLTSASEAITSGLDTRVQGIPVVVYNPLAVDREDVVEAIVPFPGSPPVAVRVSGPDGREVPAQLGQGGTVVFLARVPSVGWAVYDVRAADAPAASTLKVSESSLENTRYRVQVDGNGDVSGIFDKALGKQMLSAPARLAFQTERPQKHPAWNMDWNDQKQPPRAYVGGPAKIRIVENGPARVALRIEREAEGSRFVQTIRLAAGDAGARVEFANAIDWNTREAALKATFPLTASNPWATYSWDVGTIRRGNNDDKKFEVASVRPAQPLFDTFARTAQLHAGPLPATLVGLLWMAPSGAGCLDLPRAHRWTCPRGTPVYSPSRFLTRLAVDGS